MWRPHRSEMDAMLHASRLGFVLIDFGVEALYRGSDFAPHALPVLTYVAADGSLWAMAPDRTRVYFAQLRVAPLPT